MVARKVQNLQLWEQITCIGTLDRAIEVIQLQDKDLQFGEASQPARERVLYHVIAKIQNFQHLAV